jgi:nucleoside-diphosphate-sugar epimerase
MTRDVLVSGASGFVGRFVVQALVRAGFDVTGIGTGDRPHWLAPETGWVRADLLRAETLEGLKRDWWGVIHLAAISVPSAFTSADRAAQNVTMTLALLEHVRQARFLLVSSALVYAASRSAHREDDDLRASGLYGLSKVLCERAAENYNDRLDIRIARPFNHIGPGMQPSLAVPSILRRITALKSAPGPLEMYGRNSVRDFVDVRDVASAYISMLTPERLEHAHYNVCVGRACSIRQLAETVMQMAGVEAEIRFAEDDASGDDTSYLVGDSRRLRAETGWQPEFSLEQSVSAMLDLQK